MRPARQCYEKIKLFCIAIICLITMALLYSKIVSKLCPGNKIIINSFLRKICFFDNKILYYVEYVEKTRRPIRQNTESAVSLIGEDKYSKMCIIFLYFLNELEGESNDSLKKPGVQAF